MFIEYDRRWNCYVTNVKLRLGVRLHNVRAVIDTGATNTTVALDALVGNNTVERLSRKLDDYAKETGIARSVIRGATEETNITKAYTYNACFDNAIVGGHLMRKFHVKIMVNGARGISVIGNDFLNMCNYSHKQGEHQLIVENPDEQKYYDSFVGLRALGNEQLNILLSNIEKDEKEDFLTAEDPIEAEILRRGVEIMKTGKLNF